MKKTVALFALILILVLGLVQTAMAAEDERPTLVYFSVKACETCAELERELEAMQGAIEQTGKPVPIMEVHNIAQSTSYELMNAYFDLYQVPQDQRNTPAMFIGEHYYIGAEDVLGGIKIELARESIPPTLRPTQEQAQEAEPGGALEQTFSGMTAVNVFLVGLVNGLNPCSLSMLLFFFSMMLAKNVRVLTMGLAFGAGKLVMYLALGTIFFQLLSVIDATIYQIVIKSVMGAFILIIVFLNVRDFFMARSERYDQVKNQLPAFLRKRNHSIIQKLTDVKNRWLLALLVLLLGMAIAIGEFLCTGQMYVATIALVIQQGSGLSLAAFGYLLLYAVAFILPLLVLTIIVDRGKALFDVSEALRGKLPLIKLISAIALLILGVVYIVWL